ncbi:hypothetical protein NQ317_002481 [Molorchus minor]|uniref:Uncharacterized protein n=1 Tax=Molorchus minor TaxID=1323400 RepID=A0ABQ9IV35_9CUCU|nr:hypothetical protein NQ317_002481 [Molorchus minor]
MGYESLREETLIHALFGGSESEVVKHSEYRIQVGNLNKKYVCNFNVLDQPVICSNVTCIKEGPWTSELKHFEIDLHDTKDGPIDVLIGADIAGKLFYRKKSRY